MPILSRRRQPFDEALPDGSSVYEAIRRLSRGGSPDTPEAKPDIPLLSRGPISTTTVDPNATTITPRPLAAAPSFPAPADIAPEPLDRNVAPQTPSLRTISPPPVMMLTRGGHAVDATGGASSMDANQTLLRTQQGEVPKRESKKMVLLRTLGGLALGGIPGALQTAAGDLSDRRALDRGRINRNIADTQGDINRELLVRKSQDELLNNQTKRELENAQAIRALREPLTREPGFTLAPGQTRFGANGQPLANLPGVERTIAPHNPLIVDVKNADGSTTRKLSRDYGQTWEEAQGLGDAAPPEKPVGDSHQLAEWNYKKQREAESGAKDLRQQAERIVPTPGYDLDKSQTAQKEDLLRRATALEQDARKYRDEGDRAATKPKPLSRGTQKPFVPARDGKYHYTPDQIRSAIKPGQTYEDVLKQLQSRPNVVIDQ